MAHATAVINVVGLTRSLIGDWSPNLSALAREAGGVRTLKPVLPAVTCSVQSSMLTGTPVREHGIVGNGWFDGALREVHFWKQSNRLVGGEKVWETARRRDPGVTCANMFWWFNMYSSADWSVTPRPMYKADGRKIPDCYSHPADLRDRLQADLGRFPLFKFWGPMAGIESSRWIAEASVRVHEWTSPTLMLVYLPHLDYALQRVGPEHPSIRGEVAAIDAVVGDLLHYFRGRGRGVRPIVVSEYGIEAVSGSVSVNRALREAGLLRVREEEGLELLDGGASDAFAVVDHQVAHVYVNRPGALKEALEVCRGLPGVEAVAGGAEKAALGIDHPRAGDLVLVAERGKWFDYRYWLDDACAPDFARTVDIHRKPGYDPCELLLDPSLPAVKARIAWKLLTKKMGFRGLLDVIPLDTSLVRGSHGRIEQPEGQRPVLLTTRDVEPGAGALPCTAVRDVILDHLFND